MAKYNYHEKKEKAATYRTQVRPELIDEIYEQILRKMIVEKKYKDPTYTAKKLAEEIHTNTRYISATVSLRFQMNYAELVCGYRIRDAISMLTDKRNRDLTMAEVAHACGFAVLLCRILPDAGEDTQGISGRLLCQAAIAQAH